MDGGTREPEPHTPHPLHKGGRGQTREGHHWLPWLPWKKTGQMMELVQVEEPKASTLCVGKGRPEVGAITKWPDDADDSDNGSSSPCLLLAGPCAEVCLLHITIL